MKAENGMTLIEILVAIAIVGILSAVAIPMYGSYVQRGRIADALTGLSGMRVSMEQWYQDRRTYQSVPAAGTTCGVGVPTSQFFTFTCTAPTADTFTITATGNAAKKMSGFVYTIDQANTRGSNISASGWTATAPACWVTKSDGSC